MRIVIKQQSHDGLTQVKVNHRLENEGSMEATFHTNQVLFVHIQGYGVLEIDLSRDEDPVSLTPHNP